VVVFAARFAAPSFSRGAAIIVILFGALRLAAVLHASVRGGLRESHKMVDKAVLATLVVVIVVTHAGTGYLLAATSDTLAPLYQPNKLLADLSTPAPGRGPGATDGTPTPTVMPSLDSRVTILFTGADDFVTRTELLYDSLMVVSYDPVTNSVQMVNIPRDTTGFPLYFGDHKVAVPSWLRLNGIPHYVKNGSIFGSPDSPYMTLVNEISFLVGIKIDYYAAMDFTGFVGMVDLVGGIDIVNASPIDDTAYGDWPGYDWLDGTFGFTLAAGPQHLDGRTALAYVRSRHSASGNNNDSLRAGRQQEVMIALLHKMAQPNQVLNYPKLISTLVLNTTTNFPSDKVADYMAIGMNVPSQNITNLVLGTDAGYSYYLSNGASCIYAGKVAQESIQLFGKDSLWYGKPLPVNTCS
jgi:LCP family protein required for cell wall assembly